MGAWSSHPQKEATDLASIEQTDAKRFQDWIHRKQNPADCSAVNGTRAYNSYYRSLGLGAQLVSLKFGLLNALLQGRVLFLPRSQYVNPLSGRDCKDQSFECYFEPPSRCAVNELHAFEPDEHHWCAVVPRPTLTRLAGLRQVHSTEWYHAQLSKYLLRPRTEWPSRRGRLALRLPSCAAHRQVYRGCDGRKHGLVRKLCAHVRVLVSIQGPLGDARLTTFFLLTQTSPGQDSSLQAQELAAVVVR